MRLSRRRSLRTLSFLLFFAASSWRLPAGEGSAGLPDPLELSYYFPHSSERDEEVPEPRSVLGFEVGEWHARHDRIVAYMHRLAEGSGRVAVETYGESHEKRPLLLVAISSPENIERLETIREAHRARALGSESADTGLPAVVWLGYSVHGNEPSGANASLLVAYHLAASRSVEVEGWLDRLVVLIDPCINPDGYSRFALWANMHRGRRLVADPLHREHVEGWPNGRTNHYWFDLNRDWLLLVHPESRARLEAFHRWRPTVLGDFHEMGTDMTYFFQPGVTSRQNPRTPERNLELTRKIARHHAEALDALGSLYFTGEVFDDFYYGKGSTYPDVNGSMGILFEQASARGHVQESDSGASLSFAFAIRNQLATSLSTLRAALAHCRELLDYQGEFHARALEESAGDPVRAYVFGDAADRARTWHMVDLLRRHQIEIRKLEDALVEREGTFTPGRAFLVETAQPQYRLVKTLFERRTAFEDTTFYDVSAWTLPLAYAMPVVEVTRNDAVELLRGERLVDAPFPRGEVSSVETPYAWIFEWSGFYAPRALYRLLDAGVRARVATRPFRIAEGRREKGRGKRTTREFRHGAVVVPAGTQDLERDALRDLFETVALEDGIDVHAVRTGLASDGVDLGSPSLKPLRKPRPALLVGRGISHYEAGEAWHLLDHRFGIETPLIELATVSRARLERYTHLILVDGSYSRLGDSEWKRLRRWVRRGGVVIATRGGAEVVSRTLLERDEEKEPVASVKEGEGGGGGGDPRTEREAGAGAREIPRYGDFRRVRDRRRISGAIFEVALDLSHPLGYGYSSDRLPVFRRGRGVLPLDPDPYANAARYTGEPLLAGYASEENRKRIAGTASVIANRVGEGVVIRMIDNPAFRGFFLGSMKLFLNALFFGGVIEDTRLSE